METKKQRICLFNFLFPPSPFSGKRIARAGEFRFASACFGRSRRAVSLSFLPFFSFFFFPFF